MGYSSEITFLANLGSAATAPEILNEVFDGAVRKSAFMSAATRLPNMTTRNEYMDVASALAMAYFTETGGLVQTSNQTWAGKTITAASIDVIVPIEKDAIADAHYDIFGRIKVRVQEAIAQVVDKAVFFGTGAPTAWTATPIYTAAYAASKYKSLAACTDLYEAMLDENGVFALVEDCGYFPTDLVASKKLRAKMRGCRTTTGQKIFEKTTDGNYTFNGERVLWMDNGAAAPTTALAFAGDFSQYVYAIRQELQWQLLTEAVINDAAGKIVFNFAQQKMIGLLGSFRMGWQISNPVNREDGSATQYPVAVLVP